MRVLGVALMSAAVVLGGAAVAGADPSHEPARPAIDFSVPPNGVWPPGQERPAVITPEFSPVQVPAPEVRPGETVAYPYISQWVHDVIPIAPGHGLEAQGAIHVTAPDRVVVLNGHCLFGEPAQSAGQVPIDVDAGPLAIDILARPS